MCDLPQNSPAPAILEGVSFPAHEGFYASVKDDQDGIGLRDVLRFYGLLGAAREALLTTVLDDVILLCNTSGLRIWRQRSFWIRAAILALCAFSASILPLQVRGTYVIYGLGLLAAGAYAALSAPQLCRLIPVPMGLRVKQSAQ